MVSRFVRWAFVGFPVPVFGCSRPPKAFVRPQMEVSDNQIERGVSCLRPPTGCECSEAKSLLRGVGLGGERATREKWTGVDRFLVLLGGQKSVMERKSPCPSWRASDRVPRPRKPCRQKPNTRTLSCAALGIRTTVCFFPPMKAVSIALLAVAGLMPTLGFADLTPPLFGHG